jgi:hypothetical protein
MKAFPRKQRGAAEKESKISRTDPQNGYMVRQAEGLLLSNPKFLLIKWVTA